ncbi:MAG: ABC transporter ATP-binding protein [Motilibacteraceae bacterium]
MAEVEVRDLVKRYPKAPANAVDGVSFTVERGEVFGLLGPNGAGKTTTIGVLTTRARPTGGQAWVGGVDVVRDPVGARAVLAVVPQRNNLDRSISIRDNLLFHAAYHGVPRKQAEQRAGELLEVFGLSDRASEKPERFSGGQSQRVMIARALMHSPRVLFLDEPSTGLDPAARLFVWDRVRELREAGTTLVLTTHDMDEAAELSDRVGIMDRGRLLALDTPVALTKNLPGSQTLDVTVDPHGTDRGALLAELGALDGVERVEQVRAGAGGAPGGHPDGRPGGHPGGHPGGRPTGAPPAQRPDVGPLRARLYVGGDAAMLVAPVARTVTDRGSELTDVALGRPSLEDVFISLTGRALR